MDGREAEKLAEKFFKEIEEKMQDVEDKDEVCDYVKMILNILLGKCDAVFDVLKEQREARIVEEEELKEIHIPFFWDIKWSERRSMFERKG